GHRHLHVHLAHGQPRARHPHVWAQAQGRPPTDLVTLRTGSRFDSQDSLVEFFSHQTNFKFMATRHVWYGLSAILMIASIVMLFTRGLNLAIDFTGGVSVQASFPAMVDLGAVRTQLAAAGFREPQVQNFGSLRNIAIRLPPQPGISNQVIHDRLEGALRAVNPGATVQQLSVVGPQVGSQLETSAAWALAFTLILIFLYIAFRFHTWRLSFGAILAVLHDPILVLGWFAASQ